MSMIYNFLYVDDKFHQGTINGLQGDGKIKIEKVQIDSWENLITKIKSKVDQFDGVILDLRLDQHQNNGVTAAYKGTTLAQELRTLVKEANIKNDFPIILISGDPEIQKSLDKTGIDLFDTIMSRTKFNTKTYPDFINRLVSYANGYKKLLTDSTSLEKIFDTNNELDFRFADTFKSILGEPKHVIARFVIKMVLEKTTFLINEDYLSSRLGVSKKSTDWSKLIEILAPFKYSGVFSDYYNRWWMPQVEAWWDETIGEEENLRVLKSQQRVDLLSKTLGLKLSPIVKTTKSKSESFWTVCKGSGSPIDTIDGLVIANQDDNFPWQEKEYISIDEALNPKHKDSWDEVASLEKKRLETLISLYAKTTKRIRK